MLTVPEASVPRSYLLGQIAAGRLRWRSSREVGQEYHFQPIANGGVMVDDIGDGGDHLIITSPSVAGAALPAKTTVRGGTSSRPSSRRRYREMIVEHVQVLALVLVNRWTCTVEQRSG